MKERAKINLYLGDSLEAMKKMPDKAYDLAIVDPPYGIDINFNLQTANLHGHHSTRHFERQQFHILDLLAQI